MELAVRSLNLPHRASEIADQVTMSFGVAAMFPTTNSIPDSLLEATDRSLYAAKRQGRACVVGYEVEVSAPVVKDDLRESIAQRP